MFVVEPPLKRRQIVIAAIVFEAAIGLFAWGVGHWVEVPVERVIAWNARDAGYGVLAALPALVALLVMIRLPFSPLRRLRELVRTQIVPLFRDCSLAELLLI
jgi:hypothetical protein